MRQRRTLLTPALLLLFAAPALAQDWTHLPLPSLCSSGPEAVRPQALLEGSHLLLPSDVTGRSGRRLEPAVPPALLLQMLEEDSRIRGTRLAIHRTAPPFLVRGTVEEVAAARGILADLDRAGEELTVSLEVWLEPRFSTTPPRAGATPEGGQRFEGRALSGTPAWFGERRSDTYVGDYLVEVAADSGAAEPILGAAVTGRTVHLVAHRTADGSALAVSGVLDLSELVEMRVFDPGTPDLGDVQQPVVRAVQVCFAGRVASGEWLRVAVRGAALERSDCTLWVKAETAPGSGPKDAPGWGVLDLALLGSHPSTLPGVHPGAGLDDVEVPQELAPRVASLPPSAVSVHVQSTLDRRAGRGDAPGAPLLPTGDLLLVPWAQPEAWEEAAALVGAFERARLRGGVLAVDHGDLHVELPVLEGHPARLLAGTETALLVDYGLEIATDTWMPSPVVQPVFDGLCLEVLAESGRAMTSFWVSASDAPQEPERPQAGMGRVQLPRRRFRSDAATVPAGVEAASVLESGAGTPGLALQYHERP